MASGESWRKAEGRKGGGYVKLGRYHSRRADSPPALCAAAILQLLAVWAISGKREVLSIRGNVENAEK